MGHPLQNVKVLVEWNIIIIIVKTHQFYTQIKFKINKKPGRLVIFW
jgi:isoprenylcysteine carboxyl methyltransferase (ICMT) family protein YpbQ